MNNKTAQKKGFTLIEITIVIAVIGILSAVIIPNFSGAMQKANLNADKELIDEMNLALSADEKLYGKPGSLEAAMTVLEDAGYPGEWEASSQDCTIYWYSTNNVLVLVRTAEAENNTKYEYIIYPEEYIDSYFNSDTAEEEESTDKTTRYNSSVFVNKRSAFKYYDQDRLVALSFDLSIDVGSDSQNWPVGIKEYIDDETVYNELNKKGLFGQSNSGTQTYFRQGTTYYVYYTNELKIASNIPDESKSAYSSVCEFCYGASSSLSASPNLIMIKQKISAGATAVQKEYAYKAAGSILYSIFVQMAEGKINKDVDIVFIGDKISDGYTSVTCDVSGYEWPQVAGRSGYFGSCFTDYPVTIKGLEISNATTMSDLPSHSDSLYQYCASGFFASVSDDAVIENVIFKGLNIDSPASDVDIQRDLGLSSRSTAGLIGNISGGNVDISNVTLTSDCKIKSLGCAGGLVGYIGSMGSSDSDSYYNINISGCSVAAVISSMDYLSSDIKAGCVGGLAGLMDNCKGITLNLSGCSFTGKLSGYRFISAGIGLHSDGTIALCAGNNEDSANDFSSCSLNSGKTASNDNVAGFCISEATSKIIIKPSDWTGQISSIQYLEAQTKYLVNGNSVTEDSSTGTVHTVRQWNEFIEGKTGDTLNNDPIGSYVQNSPYKTDLTGIPSSSGAVTLQSLIEAKANAQAPNALSCSLKTKASYSAIKALSGASVSAKEFDTSLTYNAGSTTESYAQIELYYRTIVTTPASGDNQETQDTTYLDLSVSGAIPTDASVVKHEHVTYWYTIYNYTYSLSLKEKAAKTAE